MQTVLGYISLRSLVLHVMREGDVMVTSLVYLSRLSIRPWFFSCSSPLLTMMLMARRMAWCVYI